MRLCKDLTPDQQELYDLVSTLLEEMTSQQVVYHGQEVSLKSIGELQLDYFEGELWYSSPLSQSLKVAFIRLLNFTVEYLSPATAKPVHYKALEFFTANSFSSLDHLWA